MRVGTVALACLVLVMGCGSNTPGTADAQQRDSGPTTTADESTTTTVTTVATTIATTTTLPAPVTTTCRGSQWTIGVPSGWFANVQPAGSKFLSCWLIAPATVAQRFGIVDGVISIPESANAATEWLGPYIGVSSTRWSVEELLAFFVGYSGSDATVEITDNDVRIVGAAPAISVRRIVRAGGGSNELRVRVRYTLADSIGYGQKGDVHEELLVATPNGGAVIASISSGHLLGSPPPGITIDDAAIALDAIAQSLDLV